MQLPDQDAPRAAAEAAVAALLGVANPGEDSSEGAVRGLPGDQAVDAPELRPMTLAEPAPAPNADGSGAGISLQDASRKLNDTNMSEDDFAALFDGMMTGVKGLLSTTDDVEKPEKPAKQLPLERLSPPVGGLQTDQETAAANRTERAAVLAAATQTPGPVVHTVQGLGSVRTLESYSERCGIDFAGGVIGAVARPMA